ncbi:MAG: glycosyltransferase family 2 protein [Prevotellaceae bacterium]|jgi:glycosyltransferase involved in cell wall biosynthesis|nr:glycosyltransferase family 2 protein [Prevotellaceae bacterium]
MISVCIATHNGEKYIKAQLDSILCQLEGEDEVIISDDHSGDHTIDIITHYNDQRIQIYRNERRRGVIGNFENALNHAKGDFIFLADQDDVWKENKVRECMENLKNDALVISDCAVVDTDLKLIHPSFFAHNHTRKGLVQNVRHNSYIGCCMAFRRILLQHCLPFPKQIPMHDIWIGFVAGLFHTTCFIPQVLVLYRRHGDNITSTSRRSDNSMWKKIIFRWNLIRYIPLLFLRKRKNS